MIKIEVTNNKCRLVGDRKILMKVQKKFKVRHPNGFFLRKGGYVQPGWDGNIDYITDANYFKTGLLPSVYKYITEELKVGVEFIDHRGDIGIKPRVPKKVGEYEIREYQAQAIQAIVSNYIGELYFPYGVINAATNAGKTLIMAGIFLAYKRKVPMLVIINDGDLYEQFKREMPKLVGHEDFGYVRGKEAKWNKFTLIMVQTVSRDIGKHKKHLHKFGIVGVDEADLADNKSYKSILTNCYNAVIRVGLSGTIYMSKLKKDLPKNQNIRTFFGDEVFKISKLEMVAKGHSTKIVVRLIKGNTKPGIKGDYKAEYDRGIMYNEDRVLSVVERLKYNIKLNRLPALVIGQYHNHIDLLYKIIKKKLGNKLVVKYVHGGVHDKYRKKILEDFRNGHIDILIASFIIKRGKNFPKTKLLINAAGSDSQETVSQLMGRLERKDESKKKSYLEDFMDEGFYLKRHSNHRRIYYIKEGFKVTENYKN